jgi:hypothetical protein
MDSAKVNDWLQVIGLFGVIASLIFVGLEMQQAKQIAISNANQARTDASVNFITVTSSDPVMRSATIKMNSGNADSMTPEELSTYRGFTYANLMIYENLYLQYRNGFLPEGRWIGTRNNIKVGLIGAGPAPAIRPAYERNPELWSPSFRELIDSIIDEIEKDGQK